MSIQLPVPFMLTVLSSAVRKHRMNNTNANVYWIKAAGGRRQAAGSLVSYKWLTG